MYYCDNHFHRKLCISKSLSILSCVVCIQFYRNFLNFVLDYFVYSLFQSVQLLSHVQLFVTPWVVACQAPLSIISSQNLLKLMSSESEMPSTISSSVVPFSSAFNLSQHQGLFKCVSSLQHVAKVLELQIQHQSFQ